MRLTVTTLSDEIYTLDVSEDLELENFKAFCEIESGIPARELLVLHEGRPLLEDKNTLKSYGIKAEDVVLLQRMHGLDEPQGTSSAIGGNVTNIDFSAIAVPGGTPSTSTGQRSRQPPAQRDENDPRVIREMFLANPEQLAVLKQNNPRLADALTSGDLAAFTRELHEQTKDRQERDRQQMRLINADPFDSEAQKLIADEIRLRNIESNMEAAMEYNPESFGQVVMLYINCLVNGHAVKAFIDSGAQTTIMSQECAERCNIMRLVDTRWAGIAKGVGTQKIIGRVHLGQIQIEKVFLTSSFSILEHQPMEMLLGLDNLRRHQCSIDLKRNVLVIGTTGTETHFLSERDLPECARLNQSQQSMQEEDDKQLAQALQRSTDESKAGSSGAGSSSRFSEEDVNKIVAMGFTRDSAVQELRRFNGDVNQAAAALLAKSLKF